MPEHCCAESLRWCWDMHTCSVRALFHYKNTLPLRLSHCPVQKWAIGVICLAIPNPPPSGRTKTCGHSCSRPSDIDISGTWHMKSVVILWCVKCDAIVTCEVWREFDAVTFPNSTASGARDDMHNVLWWMVLFLVAVDSHYFNRYYSWQACYRKYYQYDEQHTCMHAYISECMHVYSWCVC